MAFGNYFFITTHVMSYVQWTKNTENGAKFPFQVGKADFYLPDLDWTGCLLNR